jgi:DNA repair protein RecO (recombination protein O)
MGAAPRVYKTVAIVLRHRKLGEADKILTLFTANYGKLDAVAKGVRRPTSKLAGHVEPLTYSTFLLAKGRELDIVTQAETLEPLTPLREDLERLGRGLYAAELVDRFTPDREESYPLFKLLLETLRRLATRDDLDLTLRYFEMQLLDELGYRPQLDRCVSCGAALEPTTNFWSAASGGVLCPACAAEEPLAQALSLSSLKVLRVLQRGSFGEAARVRIAGALDQELERDLREYIRYMLERDLRSAAFLETLRRRKGALA